MKTHMKNPKKLVLNQHGGFDIGIVIEAISKCEWKNKNGLTMFQVMCNHVYFFISQLMQTLSKSSLLG